MNTKPISRRQFLKKSAQVTLGLFGTASASGIYSHWVEPYWLEVKYIDIKLPLLPPTFDRFRIVHFSDLHLGVYTKTEALAELVQKIQHVSPDLICFTGDLLDHSAEYISEAVALCSQLRAPFGQYAVLGNHDAFGTRKAVTKGLAQSDFHVLHNEHVVLKKDEAALYLAGVDDPWVGKADIHQALHHIPDKACTLLLAHEPDFADEYRNLPIDLQLSGHSHGGQVRLPFVGALYTPPHGSKYSSGLYQLPDRRLQVYTTRGIGVTRMPIRFNCRPELTVITLRTSY
ncbi:metallophosphoesterase [Paenibacillus pseudetheri]|uniref:UDP-2,3-diacylglucosamine pyrophosphatase LpxG n=1 Tax=Paenibacillus pseudetheri TaxID=2897682 RepID=A0ABM9BJ51_9BACL|nr:metallophosphoesterase [Paenibacillus pseudetheri]CAH1058397.1 UDP-2,3-diacylglucosamine pyrophosphatase LpxG [Paenibacillus pseudetheri]